MPAVVGIYSRDVGNLYAFINKIGFLARKEFDPGCFQQGYLFTYHMVSGAIQQAQTI